MTARRGMTLVCLFAAISLGAACEPVQREPLRELYTPRFATVPPPVDAPAASGRLSEDWRNGGRDSFVADVWSMQGLAVLLALVSVLVAGRPVPGSRSKLGDLLLLFTAGVPLFGVMRFFDHLSDAAYLWLLDAVFTVVLLLAVAVAVRATITAIHPGDSTLTPRASTPLLIAVAAVLLATDIGLALTRVPDDAGWFVNLGGQRLRERGRLPYGDPLLTGTPAAAYGPLMYVAHVPFQLMLAPRGMNPQAAEKPAVGDNAGYYLPPLRATQLCAAAFHLIGVAALFAAVQRRTNLRVALAAVVLYSGSLAVLGIGGREYSVAGITFISHIAPAAMTLVALALLDRPAAAGVSLVAAAGLGFYPALFGPIWLGYYWREKRALRRFVGGCAIAAILLTGFVLAASAGAGGHSRLQTIVSDTLGHHTDPAGYGRSPFGFWGQRSGWREWAMQPLVGTVPLSSPSWLCLLAYVAAASLLMRHRGPGSLALFCGVVALGFAVVKPHATATYLAWYYPLVVAGLCLPRFTSVPDEV